MSKLFIYKDGSHKILLKQHPTNREWIAIKGLNDFSRKWFENYKSFINYSPYWGPMVPYNDVISRVCLSPKNSPK